MIKAPLTVLSSRPSQNSDHVGFCGLYGRVRWMFTSDLDKTEDVRKADSSPLNNFPLCLSVSWSRGSLSCLMYTVYMRNICGLCSCRFPQIFARSPNMRHSISIRENLTFDPCTFNVKHLNSWPYCFLSVWFPTVWINELNSIMHKA